MNNYLIKSQDRGLGTRGHQEHRFLQVQGMCMEISSTEIRLKIELGEILGDASEKNPKNKSLLYQWQLH